MSKALSTIVSAIAAVAMTSRAQAGPGTEPRIPLACGQMQTHQLEAGATHKFVPIIPGNATSIGIVDVVDVSGTIGDVRLLERKFNGATNSTCNGSASADSGSSIEVSDCAGSDAGTYAIALTLIPDSERCGPGTCDCSVFLACGAAPHAANLSTAGEVDSYAFTAVAGTQLRATVSDPADSGRQFRIRTLGPGTADQDICGNALTANMNDNGQAIFLVSACDGLSIAAYEIRLEQTPACTVGPTPGEILYVLNGGSGTIDVVRPGVRRVDTIVPVLTSFEIDIPAQVQVSPDGAFAYANFPYAGRLAVIDTVTNRVVANAFFPGDIVSFAIRPDGRVLYAPSSALQGIAVIDTSTMVIVSSIPVASALDGGAIAVRPDGQRLYVITSTPKIVVVDPEGTVHAVISHPGLRAYESEIRVSPSGLLAYVFDAPTTGSGGLPPGPVLAFDLTTNQVTQTNLVAPFDIAFSPDGARAYTTVAGGVGVVDTSTHQSLGFISLTDLRTPYGIGVSAAGDLLYVTDIKAEHDAGDTPDPGLAIVDAATRTLRSLVFLAGSNPLDVVPLAPPPGLCAGDEVRESKVTVGELVTSVNFALDGCPGVTGGE